MSAYRLTPSSDARAAPRRLALVRGETSARLLGDRQEVVPAAPHLLLREVILVQLAVVLCAIVALSFDAPLEGIADPLHTPNPAKAPWYFLGLQELLHYFPPVVAGVILPGLVVVSVIVIPYFRVNLDVVGLHEHAPRTRRRLLLGITGVSAAVVAILAAYRVWPVLVPTLLIDALMALPATPMGPAGVRRRLARVPAADWIMLWFVAVTVILTAIGVFFRGPGWSFTIPWRDGIF